MTKFLLRDAQENLYIFEYGRGSWTRTNGCQDQNLVPYQLGDTPYIGSDILTKNIKLQAFLGINTKILQSLIYQNFVTAYAPNTPERWGL